MKLKSLNPSNWSRSSRLIFMLVLCAIMFFVEIIVGYMAHSLALIADSFHMLSDVLALAVALYAIKLSKRTHWAEHLSYGWQRAEVLGALTNAVFLLALCFTIFLESVERFVNPVDIEQPELILIVGSTGLFINIIGLVLFHDTHHHGHSHAHHDHDHDHSHEHSEKHERHTTSPLPQLNDEVKGFEVNPMTSLDAKVQELGEEPSSPVPFFNTYAANQVLEELHEQENEKRGRSRTQTHQSSHGHSHGNMNMHGIFLHVLGDFLGSIAVIAAALIIWLSSWEYRFYVDPLLSLIMTFVMLYTTIPLLKSSSHILLQGMPSSLSLDTVKRGLLAIEGVYDVHELHIWQLSEVKHIASVHVTLYDQVDFMVVAAAIKTLFHRYGVHSVTVQPEFTKEQRTNVHYQAAEPSVPVQQESSSANIHEDDVHIEVDGPSEKTCLLSCDDNQCENAYCCPSDVQFKPSSNK
ncbi:hypothetical protein MP638_002422 [Amoeboaphelidium occidentale]|nr:hypothetical protein MP638_002422 [Amoeboaphelidium occidentale]